MVTDIAWAAKLRRARNIGDFQRWRDDTYYTDSFARVLRDPNSNKKDASAEGNLSDNSTDILRILKLLQK